MGEPYTESTEHMAMEPVMLTGEGLSKSFGANVALSAMNFTVCSGEIVALVGSNGSGKSTLLKVTYGNLIPESGCVKVNGLKLKQGSPREARRSGLEMVFQDKDDEAKLCPGVTVIENLFLGREPTSRLGFVLPTKMHGMVSRVVEQYAFPLPPLGARLGQLSGGQQKAVAIARALLSGPRILLLDEPTASLGLTERGLIHKVLKDLKSAGVGIVLCSHSLDEVLNIADRVLALRAGGLIAERELAGMSEQDVALLMSK